MDRFKETLINIDSDKFTLLEMVSILTLIVSKININSISGMARNNKEVGKGATTPRGVLISSNYKKLMIGESKLCVEGIKEDDFPF